MRGAASRNSGPPVTMATRRVRHQQRQGDMHHQEQDDCGHAEEVNEACGLEVVEQRSEFRELHRLPQRQARQHDENAD